MGLRSTEGWAVRFGVMMALSIVVAVMGLSADSAAVVIGAMLLAPLMTPVMGVAAAVAMALPSLILRPLAYVASATVGGVFGSFVLGAVLSTGPLSAELLSRTSPDVRDLLVALAAGAAGAYAIVRPDVSASLPGVAVAVALVPPLASVGLALEAGRGDLARGADAALRRQPGGHRRCRGGRVRSDGVRPTAAPAGDFRSGSSWRGGRRQP